MKRKITPNTRAIMPVHLYGYPSDMEEICRFASEQNLMIIEDCGQSHGAQIMGKYVGTMGHLGCYSFAAPRKHINVGEGGMVITNDDTLAQICRQVVNKGKDDGWMTYRRMGFSYTMPEFTAIVGLQGLAFLDEEIEHRRKAAQVYSDMFASTSLTSEPDPSDRKHTYFRYVLKLPPEFTRWRDWFIDAIMAENISIRPPHLAVHCIDWLRQQNAYRNGCPYTCQHLMQNGVPWPQRLPVADRELPTVVDIETGPGLSEDDARLTARGIVKVWTYLQDHANEIEPTSHASPR
jgi:perosamine synthetase